jgi:hypothetical protein
MKNSGKDDIPEEIFREQLKSWSHVSKFRESGSIYVYHKGIVLRRHQALSVRQDLIESIFHNQLPILIDLESTSYDDNDMLEAELLRHEANSKHPTYWICGIDRLLIGKSDTFFHYLRKRQAIDPSISYVLFFSVNFLNPTINGILTYTSTFLQNTCISPLYTVETGEYFLCHLSHIWNFSLSDGLMKQILDQSARHFSFIKQAARFIRDTKSVDLNQILGHEMMKIKLKSIYDGFLPSEQSALKKIVAGSNDFNEEEMVSINFLKKTEWIESTGHNLRITVPLLKSYISKNLFPTKIMEFADNRIILGGVPVNLAFSQQEQNILKLFISQKGRNISREVISESIWGENWHDKYSDWAIDQVISRLRKKFVSLDLAKTTIETIKGKGFKYVER